MARLLDLLCFLWLLSFVINARAQDWTITTLQAPNVGQNSFGPVTVSADGNKFAAINQTSIVTSTNSGASWQTNSPPIHSWTALASSADGTKLVAAATGSVFTSTNAGVSWLAASAPSNSWVALASSADGKTLVAATFTGESATFETNGTITVSTNSGTTWQSGSATPTSYGAVACSGDGTRLVATAGHSRNPGGIYISTNSGVSWVLSGAPIAYWTGIASSADGSKLFASSSAGSNQSPGLIFTSTDFGVTWTSNSAGNYNWIDIACSADGTRVAATSNPWGLFTSKDGGATWAQLTGSSSASFTALALSADGTALIAPTARGLVYIGESAPAASPPVILGLNDPVVSQLRYFNPAGTAYFDVVARGTTPLSYQWQFRGTNIQGANSAVLTIMPVLVTSDIDHSVYQWQLVGDNIPDATNSIAATGPPVITNAGEYQVIITNSFGSVTSSVARLEIVPPAPSAPYVYGTSSRVDVPPGGEAYFAAPAIGTEPITYQWLFKGAILPGQTNSSLYFPNIQSSGDFQVAISNSLGGEILDFPFTLQDAPLISSPVFGQSVFPGASATFAVDILGAPPFSYQWSFNGTNLAGATNPALTIPDVQAVNAGGYAVVVTNSFGSVTSLVFSLTISTNPPAPLLQTPQFSAVSGGSLGFSWSALVGQTYQVQTSTNLAQTNWINLGAKLTATNGILSITDLVGTNSPRFYRAILMR